MLFVGVDWAEAHHDLCLLDEQGKVLGRRRVSDDLEGVRRLHELIADHAQEQEQEQIVIGIEIDRGLLVQSLLAAGYLIYAINPLAVSRYRDRHTISGAKSDPGDARLLADLVRTDRHNHRPIAGDSELAEAIKVLARAHKSLVWSRQRQVNQMRSALREFYPAALTAFGDLDSGDALAVLERAPSPAQGRSLSQAKIVSALRKGGRQRNLERRANEIQAQLRAPCLQAPPLLSEAYGHTVRALVGVIQALNRQLTELEQQLAAHFELHPDAEIYLSLPGLGVVLGAGALGEFGDDPDRYDHPKARKNYAGNSPITKASGTKKVVLKRFARNTRLANICRDWAFCTLTCSPGARHYYDELRLRNKTHEQALRQLANRLVGILHGCLEHRRLYREEIAWPSMDAAA
jgi:transposase